MHPRKLLDWRKSIIYLHRWSGITLTVIFVAWFVSGIVFVYVGMPALPAEERLLRMEPLDTSGIGVSPDDGARRAGLTDPVRLRVAMLGGRPVYRFQSGGRWSAVYADTGEPLAGVSRDDAMRIVRRFAPEHASTLQYEARLTDSDQWTLQGAARSAMPMHRIALGDAAGTEYYVSERTGEPVLRTTARGRLWGYAGAVLHWLYFTPLRRHAALWTRIVVWISLGGTAMCLLGLVIGVWRYSIAPRFRLRRGVSRTPYSSWMRWHHYTGLVFGTFAATWAFSGALSLDPFPFLQESAPTSALRHAATGGAIDLRPLTVARVQASADAVGQSFAPKELDFVQFLGEPYFVAYAPPGRSEHEPWRNDDVEAATALVIDRQYVIVSALRPDAGTFTSFDKDRMWDVARAAMPDARIADATWLDAYDAYYYSHNGLKPLPVLRIRYDDPAATWLYLDPQHGAIASRLDRAARWNRWLYHGFHSLDFPVIYYKRPLWDLIVIVLSLGGIGISISSSLPAWRRLARHAAFISPRRGLPPRAAAPAPAGETAAGRTRS